MAAFSALDWTRFDFWSIVVAAGLATVEDDRYHEFRTWLADEEYEIVTVDFFSGLDVTVSQFGRIFNWESQFGYPLSPQSRNLDAFRDGFEFPISSKRGTVLECLQPHIAWHEDSRWFTGFLSIVSEYSMNQLAIGHRFFTMLVVPPHCPLIGLEYEKLMVPLPFVQTIRKERRRD